MDRIAPSSPRPRVSRLVAATLLAVTVIAATMSGSGIASASTPTTPAPEPTSAPAPEPTTATPTVPEVTVAPDDAGDDADWLPILLIIVGGVALIAIVAMVLVRRSPSSDTPRPRTAPAAPVASPHTDLLNTSQWVHDQFSLQVLAATPETALARWSVERSRLDTVAIGAHQVFLEGGGEMWQRLEQVMTLLATSIDTNVQLRSQVPPNVQLVTESANVVNQHRATLQQAINVLRASLPR